MPSICVFIFVAKLSKRNTYPWLALTFALPTTLPRLWVCSLIEEPVTLTFRRHLFDLPATKSIESAVSPSLRAPHEVGFVPRCSFF